MLESDTTFAGRAIQEIRSILADIVTPTSELDAVLEELDLDNLKCYKLIPVESNTAETFSVNSPKVSDEERARAISISRLERVRERLNVADRLASQDSPLFRCRIREG